MKYSNNESDIDSFAYSGFVITLIAVILFLVRTDNGYKLVSWGALAIFILATALAFGIKKINESY